MIKNDESENNDEEKEAECLDDTSPGNMEEGVKRYKLNTGMKTIMSEKRLNA